MFTSALLTNYYRYLEKNRDSLSRDVTMLLRNSDNALIAALFKAEITTRGTFKAKKGADLGMARYDMKRIGSLCFYA